jgi:tetratricopeptide (TPR) repeat protein
LGGFDADQEEKAAGPALGDDISADDLDTAVKAELLPLAKPVAETVARHLVATGKLIDDDPVRALEHAISARRLASRIAAVREAVGLAAYQAQEWTTAIAELRTYHRMTGRQTHLAVLADCERALGRPEKAIDLFRSAERDKLSRDEALELLIVAAGARGDMGQHDAAAAMLQIRELSVDSGESWAPRLRYAYADALVEAGRTEEAREWFGRAAAVDIEGVTDAAERLLELDGIEIHGDDEDDEEPDVDTYVSDQDSRATTDDDDGNFDDEEDDDDDDDDDYDSDEDDEDYDDEDEDDRDGGDQGDEDGTRDHDSANGDREDRGQPDDSLANGTA